MSALAAFVYYKASTMSGFGETAGSPGIFPAVVSGVILLCAVAIWREGASPPSAGRSETERFTPAAIVTMIAVTVYALLMKWFGFAVASVVYLSASFLWFRATLWWKALLIAGIAVASTGLLFRYVFQVILP